MWPSNGYPSVSLAKGGGWRVQSSFKRLALSTALATLACQVQGMLQGGIKGPAVGPLHVVTWPFGNLRLRGSVLREMLLRFRKVTHPQVRVTICSLLFDDYDTWLATHKRKVSTVFFWGETKTWEGSPPSTFNVGCETPHICSYVSTRSITNATRLASSDLHTEGCIHLS